MNVDRPLDHRVGCVRVYDVEHGMNDLVAADAESGSVPHPSLRDGWGTREPRPSGSVFSGKVRPLPCGNGSDRGNPTRNFKADGG